MLCCALFRAVARCSCLRRLSANLRTRSAMSPQPDRGSSSWDTKLSRSHSILISRGDRFRTRSGHHAGDAPARSLQASSGLVSTSLAPVAVLAPPPLPDDAPCYCRSSAWVTPASELCDESRTSLASRIKSLASTEVSGRREGAGLTLEAGCGAEASSLDLSSRRALNGCDDMDPLRSCSVYERERVAGRAPSAGVPSALSMVGIPIYSCFCCSNLAARIIVRTAPKQSGCCRLYGLHFITDWTQCFREAAARRSSTCMRCSAATGSSGYGISLSTSWCCMHLQSCELYNIFLDLLQRRCAFGFYSGTYANRWVPRSAVACKRR